MNPTPEARRVLIVEDNPGDARLISEMLSDVEYGFDVDVLTTLAAALERLAAGSVDVIILDLGLPDSQGEATFEQIAQAAPDVAIVVLTGEADPRAALRIMEEGAQDYLVKGRVDSELLGRTVRYAIGRKRAERTLRDSESQLKASNVLLERMVHDVAEAMGRVVEARDPYTQGHQERVARVSKALAVHMGLSAEEVAAVEMAALVHDIGKLGVPAEILSRPGTLGEVEFLLIKEHPRMGYDILKDIAFPWPVAQIALQHHERMDGSGYPDRLQGGDILLEARVVAVGDVVEAMASHRPYRPALGLDAAVTEIRSHPELFDADVTQACVELYASGLLGL